MRPAVTVAMRPSMAVVNKLNKGLCCACVSQVLEWAEGLLGDKVVMPSDIEIALISSISGLWSGWGMDRVDGALQAMAALSTCNAPHVASWLKGDRERLATALISSELFRPEYEERECAS